MCSSLPSIVAPIERIEELVEQYHALREHEPWDWGRDWRIDPADAARAIAATLPPGLAHVLARRLELADVVNGTRTMGDVAREALGGSLPKGIVRLSAAREPRLEPECTASTTRRTCTSPLPTGCTSAATPTELHAWRDG